jgi:hypothetical protein
VEFRLAEDESFNPFLLLGAGGQGGPDRLFLVSVLLDYAQVPFSLDGLTGMLHEVSVPPGVLLEIPFDLGTLPAGMHDVQVMVTDNPYQVHTLDLPPEGISPSSGPEFVSLSAKTGGRRAVVIVGGDEAPARDLDIGLTGAQPPDSVSPALFPRFAKAGDLHLYVDDAYLYSDRGFAGDEYSFRILPGRIPAFGDGVHAVMLFLDYRQIPIAGEDAAVAVIKVGQDVAIEASVTLPMDPGIHNMMAFVVTDPYTTLIRELSGPLYFASPFMVAIDVQ